MSLRTFERLLLASSLALGASMGVGCSDDGGSGGSKTDAGARDSGVDGRVLEEDDDGGNVEEDAGGGGGTPETLTNAAGVTCKPVQLLSPGDFAEACWVNDDPDAGVCGVDTRKLPGGDPKAPEATCVQQDVEGKASAYCGAFFDQSDALERDGEKKIVRDDDGNPLFVAEFQDGALTVENGPLKLRFEGCCLPSGECGANLTIPFTDKELSKPFTALNLHLGCTSVTELAKRLADPDAEPVNPLSLVNQPFCNYEEDEPGVATSGTLPGVPQYVCGCGEDTLFTGEGLPCLNNLGTELCGAEEATEAGLAAIPSFICGAVGATPNTRLPLPSLPNVASTVCGTKEIVAGSAELDSFPVFICGAVGQDADDPNAMPTLPNVSVEVCGTIPAVAPTLAAVPEFFCGCDGSNAFEVGCLRNVVSTVCGGLDITTGNPYLATVPAFLCGCGARIDSGVGSVCLSNVATEVCGARAAVVANADNADLSDDCVEGVPEYGLGCGPTPPPGANCVRNAPYGIRGCDNVTGDIRRLPEQLCGCGENVLGTPPSRGANGLPCLSNVGTDFCGDVDITVANAPFLLPQAQYPSAICGCGEGDRWVNATPPCFDNVLESICGTAASQ